ncbi:hypothetical protein HY491_03455 [Candidatus Woesearchaeota archaeon]|nr:hypothetical protein [Candidatus Woesearchaeota archaeon]
MKRRMNVKTQPIFAFGRKAPLSRRLGSFHARKKKMREWHPGFEFIIGIAVGLVLAFLFLS